MSIEVSNLTYVYSEGLPGESLAIDDVSFNIQDGQLAAPAFGRTS